MPAKILVAIPAYRCEQQIGRVLAGFDERLMSRLYKVIVIDNRSPDGTVKAAQEAIRKLGHKNIEVVQNRENYGLGGSHKAAFLYGEKIGVDYVAILHGDHQASTQELHSLIDEAERDASLSAVLGTRFMRSSRLQGYSPLRIVGNVGLNVVYTMLSGRITKDLGSGLNLFRMAELKDRRYLNFSDAFTFNMDLLLDYYHKNAKLGFVPITWTEVDQESNAKAFSVGWIALKTLLKWRVKPTVTRSGKPREYEFERITI